MYRMAVMALVAGSGSGGAAEGAPGGGEGSGVSPPPPPPPPPLDVSKCILLALAHDVAEAIVGDIAPGDGVSKAEKAAREEAAMEEITRMLGGGPAASALAAAFREYEAGESPEALLVKDLDKVEMVLQAGEYERAAAAERERVEGAAATLSRPLDLSEFFEGVRGKLSTPVARAWMAEAEARRPPGGA